MRGGHLATGVGARDADASLYPGDLDEPGPALDGEVVARQEPGFDRHLRLLARRQVGRSRLLSASSCRQICPLSRMKMALPRAVFANSTTVAVISLNPSGSSARACRILPASAEASPAVTSRTTRGGSSPLLRLRRRCGECALRARRRGVVALQALRRVRNVRALRDFLQHVAAGIGVRKAGRECRARSTTRIGAEAWPTCERCGLLDQRNGICDVVVLHRADLRLELQIARCLSRWKRPHQLVGHRSAGLDFDFVGGEQLGAERFFA